MPESPQIDTVLRYRICMMDAASTDNMLHEGTIAAEFGVSRTPIRQVLQKLAHERLVETRSGVGTMVAPLPEGRRAQDVRVLKHLLVAAADCAAEAAVPEGMVERLIAIRDGAEAAERDAHRYLHLRAELLEVTAAAVEDGILRDAVRAAHWRAIRWLMADRDWAAPNAFAGLGTAVAKCAAVARKGSLSDLLACFATQDL